MLWDFGRGKLTAIKKKGSQMTFKNVYTDPYGGSLNVFK